MPASHSQTYSDDNQQDDRNISVELEGFLYQLQAIGPGIFDIQCMERDFARNSICVDGTPFTISSLTLPNSSLPSPTSFRYCIIPRLTDRVIPRDGNLCIGDATSAQLIAFEFGSQLTRIESLAFYHLTGLQSICIPMSVETICDRSFLSCIQLSSFTFEPGSRLTEIEWDAFCFCWQLKSICLPASLQILHGDAFILSGVSVITVEAGNRNFDVSGDFLMNFEGVTAVRYLGSDRNPTLGREIESLGHGCFSLCSWLSSLSFESGSKLRRIEARAFSDCSELQSICIPASVEILCVCCFSRCLSLSSLSFEPESKLSQIEANVFYDCWILTSLPVPASVREIHGLAFTNSGISVIALDEGNENFQLVEHFLMNLAFSSVVRYFGCAENISLSREIESIGAGCFSGNERLSVLAFEPDVGASLTLLQIWLKLTGMI
jgi:hypothetical protein